MKKYSRVHANINLDAILHNMEAMHKMVSKDTKIMAVIKTDGYGHGAVEIAKEIEPLDYLGGFATATLEEAMLLRENKIQKPILILGYTFEEHYDFLVQEEIRPTVFQLETAKMLSAYAVDQNKKINIHIKLDTGMGRIGFAVTPEAADEIQKISILPGIEIEGIFTHFARADEANKEATYAQFEKYMQMIEWLRQRKVNIPIHHCSNSAGIVDLPDMNLDMVRAGITLYGLWPSKEVLKDKIDLHPVLELKSHIVYIKTLKKGSSISYGGTYRLDKDQKIATIPVGYGDGYCRGLSNKGYVLIHGKKAPIRGRVCMDQFMVDVTEIPQAKIGDEVTLVGKDKDASITLEELGDLSGRFNYEFACDLGKRIPRNFIKKNRIISQRDWF